jgi:hypothetical protein
LGQGGGAVEGLVQVGAIYGIGGLNPAFVQNLQQWDDGEVAVRAYMLFFMGQSRQAQPPQPAEPPQPEPL